jgi:hypothetical protein
VGGAEGSAGRRRPTYRRRRGGGDREGRRREIRRQQQGELPPLRTVPATPTPVARQWRPAARGPATPRRRPGGGGISRAKRRRTCNGIITTSITASTTCILFVCIIVFGRGLCGRGSWAMLGAGARHWACF